jgi:hypothetical protein
MSGFTNLRLNLLSGSSALGVRALAMSYGNITSLTEILFVVATQWP